MSDVHPVLAGSYIRERLTILSTSLRSDPISLNPTSFTLPRNAFLAFFHLQVLQKSVFLSRKVCLLAFGYKPNQINKEEFPFVLCHLQERDHLGNPFRTAHDL